MPTQTPRSVLFSPGGIGIQPPKPKQHPDLLPVHGPIGPVPFPPPKTPPQAPPPFQAATYTFSLATMNAAWLCSAFFDDQDHIVAGIQVDGEPAQTATKQWPDVGAGLHNLGIDLPSVTLNNPDDKVAFSYAIANASAQVDPIEKALEGVVSNLTQAGLTAVLAAAGFAVGGPVGSALGAVVALGVTAGFNALFNNCENLVAAESVAFTAQYLWNATHSGNDAKVFWTQTQHPGLTPRTPACQRSYYETTWTCHR